MGSSDVTFEAEHGQTRTIYGNRRRAKERRNRNQLIGDGNVTADPRRGAIPLRR